MKFIKGKLTYLAVAAAALLCLAQAFAAPGDVTPTGSVSSTRHKQLSSATLNWQRSHGGAGVAPHVSDEDRSKWDAQSTTLQNLSTAMIEKVGGSGVAKISYGASAPTSPSEGDMWVYPDGVYNEPPSATIAVTNLVP